MADYAISTNLISWVLASDGIFGWPLDGAEAEVIESMEIGDRLVPKFAQNPDFAMGSQASFVQALCRTLGLSYETEFSAYEDTVKWGAGAVPVIWTVTDSPYLDSRMPGEALWRAVQISPERLPVPFSTGEFLRLRALPLEIARQFKGMAAPGRHVQDLPARTVEAIQAFGQRPREGRGALRSLSLVKGDPVAAIRNLRLADRSPLPGDFAFLIERRFMGGAFEGAEFGDLKPIGEEIAISPAELTALFEAARERAVESDRFHPGNAIAAAKELADFAASDEAVREVAEFGTFYDGYVLLAKKVSQALELAARDLPPKGTPPPEPVDKDEEEDGEQIELDNLHGLTVSAVKAELPQIVLPEPVLAEAVTALRAGKHLLLSGPPGTGKSTIATALCRAVVGREFDVATATADWTTFETIGGYMPRDGGDLEFEPGLVLRALQRGRWLVVDEINRADIDKAFGPLFTLLAGGGDSGGGEDVVLPYRKAERNVRIVRAERREGASSPFAMTPVWRLIGTLNAQDKATLFQLSFAFLRRFAVIDVPLPEPDRYRELYGAWNAKLEPEPRELTAAAAMAIAFGPRELGPAILADIAEFTNIGLTATDTASRSGAYSNAVAAFLTAVRLYAVPQYEGATRPEVEQLLGLLRGVLPDPPEPAWAALGRALDGVAIA